MLEKILPAQEKNAYSTLCLLRLFILGVRSGESSSSANGSPLKLGKSIYIQTSYDHVIALPSSADSRWAFLQLSSACTSRYSQEGLTRVS